MDPFSSVATGINSSIRIFEVSYQLKAVDEQTADLLETTRHVNTNILEAKRLRTAKDHLVDYHERSWINGVVRDTEQALYAIAQLIEPARVDKTTKIGINFSTKVMWVFRDNPKVRDKHARLTVCHQSLTAVITCLHAKGSGSGALNSEKKGDNPPPYDPQLEELFNWRDRCRRGKCSLSFRQDMSQTLRAIGSITAETVPRDGGHASPARSKDPGSGSNSSEFHSMHDAPVDLSNCSSNSSNSVARPDSATPDPTTDSFASLFSFVRSFEEREKSVTPTTTGSLSTLPSSPQASVASTQPEVSGQRRSSIRPIDIMTQADYVTDPGSKTVAESPNSIVNRAFFSSSSDYLRLGDNIVASNRSATTIGDTANPNENNDENLPPSSLPMTNNQRMTRAFPEHYYEGSDGLQVVEATTEPSHISYTSSQYPNSSSPFDSSSLSSKSQISPQKVSTNNNSCRFPPYTDQHRKQHHAGSGILDGGKYESSLGHTQNQPKRGGRSWLMFHASRNDDGTHGG